MKSINIFAPVMILGMSLYSCTDFLDISPKDQLTTATTFSSYEGIKTYAWQFYEAFPAYNSSILDSENDTDLGARSRKNTESSWIWQKVTIPTNTGNYSTPFQNIRAINILLENLDNAEISDTEKKHWKSVAYLFKAYNYIDLVNKYGDITWVENNLKDDDQEILFGPRTPRDEIAIKIIELLQYAETNINPVGDGENTVNIHVVRALISRFGLREGTWRKYHGLSDHDTYLNACIKASESLLESYPKIMTNYSEVFNSASLAGKDGIILYKQYELNQVTHVLSTYPKSASGRWDLTRKAIDMYLMRDGQTRWTSPTFHGEDTPYKEFRNRDFRLYFTTPPPYKVIAPGSTVNYTHTTNPADSEYFAIMDSLSPDGMKALPMRNWNGFVVRKVPHFDENNDGQAYNVTYTGYQLMKFSSRLNETISSKDINDAPIFRIEEVMLNYAEAKKELGEFNQFICDNTINKLRNRGGVAGLNLTNIPDDPTRDPTVDPEMWEIRRERAVELMAEGSRFDDLRRWKKMEYATERKLGRWIVKAEENNKIPTLNNSAAGYVSYEGVPPTPFPDHYYLYPVPSNQIILTSGVITQNPGWEQ